LPTTLPTLDELIGTDGINVNSVAGHLLKLTRDLPATGHVYTLHAELEECDWRPPSSCCRPAEAQGWTLGSTRTLFDRCRRSRSPVARSAQAKFRAKRHGAVRPNFSPTST
jgi:hypothetical protein